MGLVATVVLLLSGAFIVSKFNENSAATGVSYSASVSAPSGAAPQTSESSLSIEYVTRSEHGETALAVQTEKKQAAGFQDTLDCFLVTAQDTTLFARNSAKAKEVAVLPAGTYVETYGQEDGWTKVVSVGQSGYVRNRDLAVVSDPYLFKVVSGKVIVNATYGLDPQYKTVFNEEAASALRVMMEAMERSGLSIEAGAKLRSAEEEEKELVLSGNPSDAPQPGHAVFQTGYAVQFYVPGTDPRIDNSFDQTPQYQWLKQHAAEYGFILRYPEGSEAVTGYRADSTIYYYVGIEDATAISSTGVTMEAYYGVN